MEYRGLSEKEAEVVGRTNNSTRGKIEVKYVKQGNFTVALVRRCGRGQTRQVKIGVSKRMPSDSYRNETGQLLALRRAVESEAVAVA